MLDSDFRKALEVATRGIAERPSGNFNHQVPLEEKGERVQTKHRNDAAAALRALDAAGWQVIPPGKGQQP